MENNAELVRLEEFVDKLLAKYNQLKTDYHALQDTLRERDAECAELKNNIFNLSTERTEVGNRVSGLIGRIEQWENEHGATTTMEKDSGNANVQGFLFSGDAENRNS
jgi:predicted nuclease with TOPRIM domain